MKSPVGLILVSAALMAASRFALLDPVENVTLDVTSPMQSALSAATEPVAEWVNYMTDVSGLSSENDRLRAENERLTNELARAREESAQQQQGQELAEVTSQFPEYQFLDANVISQRSVATSSCSARRGSSVHVGVTLAPIATASRKCLRGSSSSPQLPVT